MKLNNNLILAGIFFVLLVLFILQKTVFKPDPQSFRAQLTDFDRVLVDRIAIENKGDSFELVKEGENWKAVKPGMTVVAKSGSVDGILESMSGLKTKQLVSRNPEKWADYELDDVSSKKLVFFNGDKELASLVIGRFDFDQQSRSATSYARLAEENEIYSIDGFASMSVARDFNSFRENKLVEITPESISKIKMISGDLEEQIDRSLENNWVYGGVEIDSSSIATYLNGLRNLQGRDFNDDFLPDTGFGVIKSISLGDSVQVDAYLGNETDFVVKSNQNDAYFNSDSTGIYKNLFTDLEELLGKALVD